VVQEAGGSSPLIHPRSRSRALVLYGPRSRYAPLAQLAEHPALNRQVRGSSPWRRTIEDRPVAAGPRRFGGPGSLRRIADLHRRCLYASDVLLTVPRYHRRRLAHRRPRRTSSQEDPDHFSLLSGRGRPLIARRPQSAVPRWRTGTPPPDAATRRCSTAPTCSTHLPRTMNTRWRPSPDPWPDELPAHSRNVTACTSARERLQGATRQCVDRHGRLEALAGGHLRETPGRGRCSQSASPGCGSPPVGNAGHRRRRAPARSVGPVAQRCGPTRDPGRSAVAVAACSS
jgi:hypothetical protein